MAAAFAAPILETAMANCDSLNARLRHIFLELEKNEDNKRTSIPTAVFKVNVYESSFDLFSNPIQEIQTLRDFCLNTVGRVVSQLNGYGAADMQSLRIHAHSWYHITRHGGYTAQHNHPMASWSGVYCVDPGDQAQQHKNSGALRFLDLRGAADMYLDAGNAHLERPFTFGALAYFLVPGQLLLFPSYLIHEVAPYFGQRERITVAFNAWVREARDTTGAPFIRDRRPPGGA